MVAIIDYGVGNLFSLKSSLKEIGAEAVVTSDEKVIAEADRIILPGVGAFEDAARKLRESGMAEVVKREASAGKPMMGICLGMGMLQDAGQQTGMIHMPMGQQHHIQIGHRQSVSGQTPVKQFPCAIGSNARIHQRQCVVVQVRRGDVVENAGQQGPQDPLPGAPHQHLAQALQVAEVAGDHVCE